VRATPAFGCGEGNARGDIVGVHVIAQHVPVSQAHPEPTAQVQHHGLGDPVGIVQRTGAIDPRGMHDHRVVPGGRVRLDQRLPFALRALVGCCELRPAVDWRGAERRQREDGGHVHQSRNVFGGRQLEQRSDGIFVD